MKTPTVELIRSLEKREIPCYLYHFINLHLELCGEKSILLKNIKFGAEKFYSSLKF